MADTTEAAKAKGEMESARTQVLDSEKEIKAIKNALRQLGTPASGGVEDGPPNSLEISALKVSGLPEGAQPRFRLQLSSPVEEHVLTKLLGKGDDSTPESTAVITQVETAVATLTVEVMDTDIPLGVSAPHDVAPLCTLDAMNPQPQYVTELSVAILAPGSKSESEFMESQTSVYEDAVEVEDERKEEGAEETKEASKEPIKAEEGEESSKPTTVETPVCTVTFRVTYKPSSKDQREELYDMLNKASQRKAQAIDRLRQSATAVSRSGAVVASSSESSARSAPAVKAGFLNKGKKKEPGRMNKLYQRFIGPESLTRKVLPVAWNYIIFFGFAALMHFKGDMLALPPPV